MGCSPTLPRPHWGDRADFGQVPGRAVRHCRTDHCSWWGRFGAGLVPEPVGLIWLFGVVVIGAAAFTALGLLIAGTVRAEATLAVANVAWVLMGAAGGAVLPLNHEGAGALLMLLPSAALGDAVRDATMNGHLAVIPVLILAAWALAAILAARKWFTWK